MLLGPLLLGVGVSSADAQWTASKLSALDGSAGDRFGHSVSLSGERALVGAWNDGDSGTQSGAAYLFAQDTSGSWSQAAKLVASDAEALDVFGFSVSLDGNRALVGAQGDDDKGDLSGSAYLFEQDATGAWLQVAKLTASDGAAFDRFGYSVALSGDRALIGAFRDDDYAFDSGAAYLFERDQSGGWAEIAKLAPSDGTASAFFGRAVALDGNRALIGARSDLVGGVPSGSAYVFDEVAPGDWQQAAKLTPSDGAAADFFGEVVALQGTRAVVGAQADDDDGDRSGSVYLFEATGAGAWLESVKLIASDGLAGDEFGRSVALDGDRLVVGAFSADANGLDAGAVYLFELGGAGLWNEIHKFVPPGVDAGDVFGSAVSLNGDRLLAGAPGDDGKGSAFILDPSPPNLDPIADAGPDQDVECTGGLTAVQLDGSASSDPDGDSLSYEWSAPAGVILDDPGSATPTGDFPFGPSLLTLTVTDGNGGISSDDVNITVQDTSPPVVVCTTDLISLLPPNHSFRTVQICVAVTEACSDFTLSCAVSSSEPDDAGGDGAFTGDVDGQDAYSAPVTVDLEFDAASNCFVGEVELRAERDGARASRSYSIECDVTDLEGNTATAGCVVVVPHDRRKLQ